MLPTPGPAEKNGLRAIVLPRIILFATEVAPLSNVTVMVPVARTTPPEATYFPDGASMSRFTGFAAPIATGQVPFCATNSSTPTFIPPTLLDAELLDPIPQCAKAHAEELGRGRFVVARFFESFDDGITLDVLEL